MPKANTYVYAEDDPLSREIMKFILEYAFGAEQVVLFEDTANFMERLTDLGFMPSIILLDIHIQPHSGIEILQQIKSDTRFDGIPVIALTASVMNEEIETLKQAGFNGAIAKPVNVETLPSLLQRVINGEIVWHII